MIWSKEVIRVDCSLKAYVKIQNDWTGNISGRLYEIKENRADNHVTFYVNADGERQDVTAEREKFLAKEDHIKRALKFYEQHGGW